MPKLDGRGAGPAEPLVALGMFAGESLRRTEHEDVAVHQLGELGRTRWLTIVGREVLAVVRSHHAALQPAVGDGRIEAVSDR